MSAIVEKYAEKQILGGRTHQEVFNEIAKGSDLKIHDIAEALRKIVSPARRNANKTTNYLLAAIMTLLVLLDLLTIAENGEATPILVLVFLFIRMILVWGVLKFWKNIYRVCLLVLWGNLGQVIFAMIMHFDWMLVPALFFLLNSIVICFYLNVKTCTDYRLNRELLEKNPGARENAVIFDE